jgi:hypothetical protein
MARRDEQGSTLSAHRAFVVHFGTTGGSGRRRFSGRVEHLSSGESMRFTSLKGLLAFFATALDVAAGAAPLPAAREQPPAIRDVGSVLPRLDPAQRCCQHSGPALHQHRKENRP